MTVRAAAVPSGGVFLDAYLAPIHSWLVDERVTEILVQHPGEIWIESAGSPGMRRVPVPELDDVHLQRLAEQIARVGHQAINRERPLLATTLPDGTRVQVVAPSATRGNWAFAFRRHRLIDLPLDAYDRGRLQSGPSTIDLDPMTAPIAFLRRAVAERKTILISGGTSTGKTTFLNALLREVPPGERIILVEDTAEIRLPGDNGLGLLATKGEMGEALVTTDDLIRAALRLRPDRIVLGELRGSEVIAFLRAINTGHPGSFSTVHANSPRGAIEQVALLSLQAGIGLARSDVIAFACSIIDIVVQLERANGERRISAIMPTSVLEIAPCLAC